MDIITHTMIGVIGVAPFFESSPMLSCFFVVGSLFPDFDSFLRCFGKRFYMKTHQVYTHSIPMILLFCILFWLALRLFVAPPVYQYFFWTPMVLALGAILHSLLDYTNTFGIALFFPFSSKRYCTEWVFFIDSVVLLMSVSTLIAMGYSQYRYGYIGLIPLYVYISAMLSYWLIKWRLRNNCARYTTANTTSLIPSALIPWYYLGTAIDDQKIETFAIHALTGEISQRKTPIVYDKEYKELLQSIAEYKIMSKLSSAYRVTEVVSNVEGKIVKCRDLRTRNFNTTFGGLDIFLNSKNEMVQMFFHV